LHPQLPFNVQVKNVRYYSLDLTQSLASQLEHKTIIEFPEFLVLLPTQIADYKLMGESSSACIPLPVTCGLHCNVLS